LVGWEEGFSGDKEVARLAEGVLLCEDVRDVEALLVVPLESFVRRLALRDRCRVVPISPSVDEMLWRDACLRRGGVEGGFGGNSYWLGSRASASPMGDTGGRLMVGGEAAVRAGGGRCEAVGVLGGFLCLPPKKDGLREKMLCWSVAGAPGSGSSAIAVRVRLSFLRSSRPGQPGGGRRWSSQGLMLRLGHRRQHH
jgi:hypothetical protein